jgi:ribonuclease BN (tRNA processing enzyme)
MAQQMLYSSMKKIFIIGLMIIMSSCSSYPVGDRIYYYSPSSLDTFVESNHYTTNNINKINKKILRSLDEYGYRINKSKSENPNRGGNRLLVYGKDSKHEQGYLLIEFSKSNNKNTACILYKIRNESIFFTIYSVPNYCVNWEAVKPHLTSDNNIKKVFGGE